MLVMDVASVSSPLYSLNVPGDVGDVIVAFSVIVSPTSLYVPALGPCSKLTKPGGRGQVICL